MRGAGEFRGGSSKEVEIVRRAVVGLGERKGISGGRETHLKGERNIGRKGGILEGREEYWREGRNIGRKKEY
jgi:hypothetical protein